MEYKKIGNTDLTVSSVGIGTAFRSGISEESVKVISRALDLGVTLIDTAEIYHNGRSEELISKVISDRREKVIIKTKVEWRHLRYKDVLKAAEGSRKRLGIDEIDLYLIHSPNPRVPLEETMGAMEKLVDRGIVRQIGVSNFDVQLVRKAQEALSKHEIAANEVNYNIIERDIESNLLPYCRKENITIIAYSPLARGLLTGRFHEDTKISEEHWRTRDSLFQGQNFKRGLIVVRKISSITAAHGKTPGQVAINWLASKPGVVPVFGVTNVSQVEENCGAVGWRIGEEELRSIEGAYHAYIESCPSPSRPMVFLKKSIRKYLGRIFSSRRLL